MKTQTLRAITLLVACVLVVGLAAGCDKAEKALQNTDVGTSADLTRLLGDAVASVGGIKDLDSARAALPALQQIDVDLGPIVNQIKAMAPEQKAQLTALAAKAVPQLQKSISGLASLPGVGEIVGPTLTSLQEKLSALI